MGSLPQTLADILDAGAEGPNASHRLQEMGDAQGDTEVELLKAEISKLNILLESARADWRSAVLAAGGVIPEDEPKAPATMVPPQSNGSGADGDGEFHDDGDDSGAGNGVASVAGTVGGCEAELRRMTTRAKYIPLRLKYEERKKLRLVESALHVSEYTDKVDILSGNRRSQRAYTQLQDICSILSGLLVASDYKAGQELMQEKNFVDNAEFFRECFEIARRYKIQNPEKMRSEYGKLVYMLMDAVSSQVLQLMEFNCVKPVQTVAVRLEELGASPMLGDPLILTATMEILAEGKTRYEIDREIHAKSRAVKVLANKYGSTPGARGEVEHCIYSIADNNTYLRFNRDPVDRMIEYLKTYFSDVSADEETSLAIVTGRSGARLTHSHQRQYQYVLQSMTLWREILDQFYALWMLAEDDMLLSGNSYSLRDTGQGFNRVQAAPKVSRRIHRILDGVISSVGSWVGSSAIHISDHNVPNALMFIDKYTQVARILSPIVLTLDELKRLHKKDPKLVKYMDDSFGGLEGATKMILRDFFRYAFDGSGADNMFDAGSCVDGRLTSAWNWCSKIDKKPFYSLFLLTGFTSFDGSYK